MPTNRLLALPSRLALLALAAAFPALASEPNEGVARDEVAAAPAVGPEDAARAEGAAREAAAAREDAAARDVGAPAALPVVGARDVGARDAGEPVSGAAVARPRAAAPDHAATDEDGSAAVAVAGGDTTDGRARAADPDVAEPDGAEADVAEADADVADADAADADAAEAEAAEPAARPRARKARPNAAERWIRERVPANLQGKGALGVEWWQWIAVPLLGLVSAGAGRLAGSATRGSLHRLVRVTPAAWDDALLERSRGPLYLAWGVGAAWVLSTFLFLKPPAAVFVADGLRIGLLVALLWLGLRGVDIAGEAATQTAQRRGNPGAASVVPLVVRSSKIGLVALGAVSVLSALGYPVASLLAGLGIGGLALALAAQKTAENVFGSVSIGVDQPFRVGDVVKIEDFIGVVERIGLRSTSIRTADRTLVTLPNGRLADMRVENFSVRDRMRLFCTLALDNGTPPERVRAVLAGLEARLRAHPQIWPDVVNVRLARIGLHALEIDVSAWFLVADNDAFHVVREQVLLQFLEVIEETGARFAQNAQPVHVVNGQPRPIVPT